MTTKQTPLGIKAKAAPPSDMLRQTSTFPWILTQTSYCWRKPAPGLEEHLQGRNHLNEKPCYPLNYPVTPSRITRAYTVGNNSDKCFQACFQGTPSPATPAPWDTDLLKRKDTNQQLPQSQKNKQSQLKRKIKPNQISQHSNLLVWPLLGAVTVSNSPVLAAKSFKLGHSKDPFTSKTLSQETQEQQ